jgi:Holliday junction resolvase
MATHQIAEHEVAQLFSKNGWNITEHQESSSSQVDLIATREGITYAIEIKSISEGRPDRVIALLSQAILQAKAHAEAAGARPLAVVRVGTASRSLIEKMVNFRNRYAVDVAIGLVSDDGSKRFIGQGLESLNSEPLLTRNRALGLTAHSKATDLFSDLNQWLFKVLLAPELPERFLTAPRGTYKNASELSGAADVSLMTASRFISRLREEGYLDESLNTLQLVRRSDLFHRWQSASLRAAPEMRMRYLVPGAKSSHLKKIVSDHKACMGLFAAADELQVGHVSGVPAYVYVGKIPRATREAWKGLIPAKPGERTDVILRQAYSPQSIFRAAVWADGVFVTDVLQVWLDVSAHSSRGKEQADLLRHKILHNVLGVSRE